MDNSNKELGIGSEEIVSSLGMRIPLTGYKNLSKKPFLLIIFSVYYVFLTG